MNYIINPNWFYWLQVLSNLSNVILAVAAIATLGLIVNFIIFLVNYFIGVDFKDLKNNDGTPIDPDWRNYLLAKKFLKVTIPTAIIFIIAAILIPSKETIISMMIAKYATKENLGMTVEGIKSAVDYIINAIKEIKG